MKIAGIIAEYNPFHNGHAYQIKTLRQETGADYVIAVISGDFIQRGEPAIMDKYARARMALINGVDLVIELPVLFSCASAEYFAAAGVALLTGLGCVDMLCFGAETDCLARLTKIAELFTAQPEGFRTALRAGLKRGLSFPQARAAALADYCFKQAARLPGISRSELEELLASPNNILAIEYLKAIKQLSSPLAPYVIKRQGGAYHDGDINQTYASASAIRRLLLASSPGLPSPTAHAAQNGGLSDLTPDMALCGAMPANVLSLLTEYASENPLLKADDFSRPLGYRLLAGDDLTRYADCAPELVSRVQKNLFSYQSFTDFCSLCKSRDITYSRVSRALLHVLLGHTEADYRRYKAIGYAPYARILGLRRENFDETKKSGTSTATLLHTIKKSASLPLISKLADAPKLLSPLAMQLLEKDIFAAHLYEQTKYMRSAENAGPKQHCRTKYAGEADSHSPAKDTGHAVCHCRTKYAKEPGHRCHSEYTREIVVV